MSSISYLINLTILFSLWLLVYLEFTFLLLESILVNFQKIFHFNCIFKCISRSMKHTLKTN